MSAIESKGEDVYAYTRILKYRNKRSGMSIKDLIFLLLTIIINVTVDFYINNFVTVEYSTLMFIINIIYIIFLLTSFLDYAAGLGIFKDKGVVTSAIVLLISIFISTGITFLANSIFTADRNQETMALIALSNFIFISMVISYFLMISSPRRQDREQMIKNLTDIKNEIAKIPVSKLGIKDALNRSTKWLQFQQSKDRIWGTEQPMYETAEILKVFFGMKKDLNYSWRDIANGEEDIHKLEQTYYLLLDTIEKAKIEPSTPILSALITVGMVNPENMNMEIDQSEDAEKLLFKNALKLMLEEYSSELKTLSEWDFITDLENLDYTFDKYDKIPKILLFARIYHILDIKEDYFRCGEIVADTFNILINRSDSRFNSIEQKEISNYILALMYNTLNILLRPPIVIGEEIQEGLVEVEEEENEFPGMALPGFDDFDFDDDVSVENVDRMNIGVSLAAVRNLIRKKQEIDGSWGARIDTTAECLIAVMDKESAENVFIKNGIHYLLALQEKNGSWQNNTLLTAQVIKALNAVNQAIGGFGL